MLRKSRDGVLPHQVGDQKQPRRQQGNGPVKEPEPRKVPDKDRSQKKENTQEGDCAVARADHLGDIHCESLLDRKKGCRLQERMERSMGKIRKSARGNLLFRAFELADCQGADVARGEPLARDQGAGDLGLIHRLLGAKPLELIKEIEDAETGQHHGDHSDLDEPAQLSRVDVAKNCLKSHRFMRGVW